MRNMQIEALFGGVLALAVIAVAVLAVANTGIDTAGHTAVKIDPVPVSTKVSLNQIAISSQTESDLVCECYDTAFNLAGKTTVLSPEYRTGFEQCRTRAGIDGGDAWTAGWGAREHSRPYEASCKAYKRRRD